MLMVLSHEKTVHKLLIQKDDESHHVNVCINIVQEV